MEMKFGALEGEAAGLEALVAARVGWLAVYGSSICTLTLVGFIWQA